MYFSEDKVSEIIEKNDIVDLISQYLSLKSKGKNHWGLCPFHTEKTPSFSVSKEKQMFYCFGCGVGGNVITFIQKVERLSYIESLYYLAKRARIQIDDSYNKEDLKAVKEKELLYSVNTEAAKFFYRNTKDNPGAISYLNKRSLSKESIKKFGIGYSLNSWNALNKHLNSKGFSDELIEKAGLIIKKDSGYYDRFRSRLMFPIMNLKNKVIAFGGRVLDESKPKYLNSPETAIYSKSNNIYSLNNAKEVMDLENIIVVEGYMDVISLYQHGFKNVVASLGTAFTQQQAKLLKRYSNEIIIAYDSDAAGQSATLKGLSILHKEGCKIKILTFPKGMDPDDLINEKGVEAFKSLLDNSYSLTEYKILLAKKNVNADELEHRIRFTRRLAVILGTLESPIEVDAYIKKYSKEMQISEEAIYAELKKIKNKHINGNNRHNIISNDKNTNGQLIAEKKILNICISSKEKGEIIFSKIKPEYFSLPLHEKIASIINLQIKEGKSLSAGEVLIHLKNDEEVNEVSKIFNIEITEDDIENIDLYINKIFEHSIEGKIAQLTNKMNEYYKTGEKEKANSMFKEIMDLQKKKK